MGLFYGASVVSLFELSLFIFKTLWAALSPKRAHYLVQKAKEKVFIHIILF